MNANATAQVLLLYMCAALSLTLTFEKLLLLHRHAALSLTLKLELLLLPPHKHAALSLNAALKCCCCIGTQRYR